MNRADIIAKLRAKGLLRPSAIALTLSNLVPVFGVLALGWDAFPILLLYWMENVVIGFYNVLRMAWCADKTYGGLGMKLVLIPFFCVHYGVFCGGHGFFVILVFGGKPFWQDLSNFVEPTPAEVWQKVLDFQLIWALLGLLISHGVSFVSNYLRQGEYRRVHLPALMFQPYNRIVALQLAVVVGGFALMFIGAPQYALVMLILLKIRLDVGAHLAERAKYKSRPGDEPTDWIANLLGRRRKR